jgi:hypothetical protein
VPGSPGAGTVPSAPAGAACDSPWHDRRRPTCTTTACRARPHLRRAAAAARRGGAARHRSGAGGATAGPTPRATCGPGSLPETDLQGRIPPADVASGRAAQGYTCNAEQVGFSASSAGWRVERYGDCAYYNGEPGGAPLFLATDPTRAGTYVMDVSDPENPVETAFLRSPAMLTPHESMEVSQVRGLLVAVAGNLGTLPGVVDVYDIATDCRNPRLLSSANLGGVLGHEGGLSPDGRTYYVGSAGGGTLTAVDISDPRLPVPVAVTRVASHGLSLNADGTRLYDTVTSGPDAGMIVYDVSSIQAREPGAGFEVVSRLTWPEISIPQSTIPVTIGGRPYVIESDEFNSGGRIGASRIIDISDETAPRVVSNLRLEVHEPANAATVAGDTPALIGGPYSGHFCSVPTRVEPGIVACAMLRSGVRVFDITDPLAPREVAYFSPPAGQDCAPDGGLSSCLHTGSTVAFVPERSELWISGPGVGLPRRPPHQRRLRVGGRRAARRRPAAGCRPARRRRPAGCWAARSRPAHRGPEPAGHRCRGWRAPAGDGAAGRRRRPAARPPLSDVVRPTRRRVGRGTSLPSQPARSRAPAGGAGGGPAAIRSGFGTSVVPGSEVVHGCSSLGGAVSSTAGRGPAP